MEVYQNLLDESRERLRHLDLDMFKFMHILDRGIVERYEFTSQIVWHTSFRQTMLVDLLAKLRDILAVRRISRFEHTDPNQILEKWNNTGSITVWSLDKDSVEIQDILYAR